MASALNSSARTSASFAEPPTGDAYTDAASRTIRQAKNVRADHASLRSALAEGYPVVVSLRVFDSFGNNRGGFVCRPTGAELSGGESGYHAMVVVGYTDEYQFYIVRNSWGTAFGDKGYCYIPYNYLEDASLCRSCCVVTRIADGTDAGGLGTDAGLKASFDSTDARLRYAVIRNQVESEKMALAGKREAYQRLRTACEQLVQTLCRPDVRNMLRGCADVRLRSDISEQRDAYDRQMAQRSEELERFGRESRRVALRVAGVWLCFALALAFCLYQRFESQSWAFLSAAGLAACSLALLLYPSFRHAERKRTERSWSERLERMSAQRAQTEQELKASGLRAFVAGVLLDRTAQLESDVKNAYLTLRSYVGNLAVWHEEEAARLQHMSAAGHEPFVTLISNEVLDAYSGQECGKLVADVWLCDALKDYQVGEAAIIGHKNRLRGLLARRLLGATDDFSVFGYITRRKEYPYLDHRCSDIGRLLPLLDQKSMPFLHYTVRDLQARHPVQRSIFIHTGSDEEQALWRETYPRFFQMTPGTAGTVSRFRLVVVQKQDISRGDVPLLGSEEPPAEGEHDGESRRSDDFSKTTE